MKRSLTVGAMIVAIGLGSVMALGAGGGWWKPCTPEPVQNSLLPIETQEALLEALLGAEGEYAAYATYAAILEAFGDVAPFGNIMESEAKHIESLKQILDRYNVPYLDENPYLGVVQTPESLAAAAQAGVDAEIANVALYEEQLAAVSRYPDIVEVFVKLQIASQENHLPAFERAAARY